MAQIDETMRAIRQVGDRQEALISAVDAQTDCIAAVDATLKALLAWMNEPPSTKLEDALREVAAALKSVDDHIVGIPEQVATLVLSRLR